MDSSAASSLKNLNRFEKALYSRINETKTVLEEQKIPFTEENYMELLMNYKEYQRQSPQLLLSLTKKLMEKTIGISFENPIQSQSQPNLMNKSLPFMKKKKNNNANSDENNIQLKSKNFLKELSNDGEEPPHKKFKSETIKLVKFEDFGGIEDIINEIQDLITYPLKYPHIFSTIGVQPPKGILICGPPGSGKSMLGLAICNEMGLPFKRLTGTEIISAMSGESESRLRQIFEEAKENAPYIIFIDEIDTIAPRKESAAKEMEKRIVTQLMTCIDDVVDTNVFIIGATSKVESLEPNLRRSGRFDKEIMLSIPDEKARLKIIQTKTKNLKMENIDLNVLAKCTPGYVGADIDALVKEAGMIGIKRIFKIFTEDQLKELPDDVLSKCHLEFIDFQQALKRIQPTAKREGFSVIPDISWDNVGALQHLREELESSIIAPIKAPETYSAYGINPSGGVLLWGPPGCGKTLLAKAVASESKANFIAIKGPELLNKYVGESEKAIRELFRRAKTSAPCIIFFDEVDAVCPKRGNDGNAVTERVVNQLLTELDGMEERKNIFVIAATNRPDIIDIALLRPGRLDKILYVPIPTPEDRVQILEALTRKTNLNNEINLDEIGKDIRCTGYSGADLNSLVKEAATFAIKRGDPNHLITKEDFMKALDKIVPSISQKDKEKYEHLQKNLRSSKMILN